MYSSKEKFFSYLNRYFNKKVDYADAKYILNLDGVKEIRFFNKINKKIVSYCINNHYDDVVFKFIPFKIVFKPSKNQKIKSFNISFYKHLYFDVHNDFFKNFKVENILCNLYLDKVWVNYYDFFKRENIMKIMFEDINHINKLTNLFTINYYRFKKEDIKQKIKEHIQKDKNSIVNFEHLLQVFDPSELDLDIDTVCKLILHNVEQIAYISDQNLCSKIIKKSVKERLYFKYITSDFFYFKKFYDVNLLKELILHDIIRYSWRLQDYINKSYILKILDQDFLKEVLLKSLDFSLLNVCIKHGKIFCTEFLLKFIEKYFEKYEDKISYYFSELNFLLKIKHYDLFFLREFLKIAEKNKINIFKNIDFITQDFMNLIIDEFSDFFLENRRFLDFPILTDERRQIKLIEKNPKIFPNIIKPTPYVSYLACKLEPKNFEYLEPVLLDESTVLKLRLIGD